MSLQALLKQKEITAYTTSKVELDNLRNLIARDLADAAVTAISADRRFATAYNAALQTATMVVECSGYRASGKDHHKITLTAAQAILGPANATAIGNFDRARRKRNQVDYDRASVATDTEAEQLLKEAQSFLQMVESWITQNYPGLKT